METSGLVKSMFELPPFLKCPKCKKESFGTLSVGGNNVTKRCKDCSYSHDEILPDVDKRVIYLDQFAVSELYKTKEGKRRVGAPSEKFWQSCYALADLAYKRQQVIFPASNLHSDETIVWHSPNELRLAHEMFSGETSFDRTDEIATNQEWEFAEAYISASGPPALTFNVDDILSDERNDWLPVYHISVNSDYSVFAPGLRKDRSTAENSLKSLAEGWAKSRRTFDQILKHELSSYGSAMREALRDQVAKTQAAFALDDPSTVLELRFGLMNRYRQLATMFIDRGVPPQDAFNEVSKFLDWPGNQEQPAHKIFAYLIAALGWHKNSLVRSRRAGIPAAMPATGSPSTGYREPPPQHSANRFYAAGHAGSFAGTGARSVPIPHPSYRLHNAACPADIVSE